MDMYAHLSKLVFNVYIAESIILLSFLCKLFGVQDVQNIVTSCVFCCFALLTMVGRPFSTSNQPTGKRKAKTAYKGAQKSIYKLLPWQN